ncbi:MAG: hypothetical protein ACI8YB_000679 [Patiriisocius sp.]|jgi:hypothetical protein
MSVIDKFLSFSISFNDRLILYSWVYYSNNLYYTGYFCPLIIYTKVFIIACLQHSEPLPET